MQKGWVYEPVISSYEALLFYNALKRHKDQYNYNPIAIARREETGMKYRFFCIATPKAIPDHPSHFADIEIYKPINGMPYASYLHKLEFDKLFTMR